MYSIEVETQSLGGAKMEIMLFTNDFKKEIRLILFLLATNKKNYL